MMELRRALEPLQRKLRMMAGRAVLSLMQDAVIVQVKALDGEPLDNAELFQQYGFRSRPLQGAEGVLLALGGNRDHTIVVCMDDRRYQLDLLANGEAAIYDDLGKYVHLKRDGSIVVKAATKVRMEVPLLEVTGEIKDNCDTDGYTMADMRAMHNDHDHTEHDVGGPTSKPNQVFA